MRASRDLGAPNLNRRHLLALGLAAAPAIATAQEMDDAPGPSTPAPPPQPVAPPGPRPPDWNRLRAMWDLDWGEVDLSAMLFASNPKPVREAITRHRAALDRNPVTYL